MTAPTKVTFDGVDPSPALTADIERYAGKLSRLAPDLLGCEVTVSRSESSHKQGNRYLVRVRGKLKDGWLEAGRTPEADRSHADAHVAVRDSFDALQRQLEDHQSIQRDRSKA
jgi:ribosome-associated translation inhibitor RaiA